MYEAILDMVLQGIYVVDPEENIVWLNNIVEEMDGVKREEIIGKKDSEAWKNLDLKVNATQYTIDTGKQSEEQIAIYNNKDGYRTAMFMQSYPFYYEHKLEYVYSLAHFIDYSEKQLIKISEYKQKTTNINVKLSNNTSFTLYDVVGNSKKMRALVQLSRKAALSKSPILLYGKTGTGKEIIAQGIHNASLFNNGRFVAINCASIPENLLETILFGSVKGAFTGAVDKPGLFEEAQNGTLFLDELNSLPLSIQGKLLRVLQEKRANRVGSNHDYPIKCRVISATNQDPRQLVRNGKLRQDLFFRLAVVTLEIPSLAERKDDIPELVKHFIDKFNAEYQLHIKTIDDEILDVFNRYSWPGNVRELENVIEYMVNFTDSPNGKLSFNELPLYLKEISYNQEENTIKDLKSEGSLHEMLEEFEKNVLERTLAETKWNVSQAARNLGIHREALHYRIRKFGLRKKS
ncbi:sigma-54 interaction domain-containing protein [Dehalobacterium formicoaceticum]|uniref:sigma-54 interaction domain-containing protein n=1 Tax=Dehalobacterium formicoaceticum TaxID=51515 RepID=UPI0023EED94C|nr:sigma 54-interacting transcriptional regulator [Dehalobacterium formicoaceticum]